MPGSSLPNPTEQVLAIYKRVHLPQNFSEVTRCDQAAEIDPRQVEMTKSGIESIWRGVTALYGTGIHPAISFCLRRHGRIVLKRSIGHSRGNGTNDSPDSPKVVASPDEPYCLFSASKAALAMLMHLLVEQKKIRLQDRISDYIPEFGAHGKHKITIEHALSHRGGFPAMPEGIHEELFFDFDACVKAICDSKPQYPAGKTVAYHTYTSGFVLAEIVRRVSGMDIRQLLRKTIQEPLGFKYFGYGVPEELVSGVARNCCTGFPIPGAILRKCRRSSAMEWRDMVDLANDERWMRAIIPSGNLIASADEMTLFYQMLLNGGELEGKRIFKPDTVRQAIRPVCETPMDRTLLTPMRYSAGFMLGNRMFSLYLPFWYRAFGHWGFTNIFCWADPSRDIVVSLLNNGKAFLGPYVLVHFYLLSLIARHCPKVKAKRSFLAEY